MNFLWFSPAVPRQLSYLNLVPSASQLPSHILAIACTTSFFTDIAIYAFQIGSMLAGYEKLPRGFEESETEKYFK